MLRAILPALILLVLLAAPHAARAAGTPIGRWLTEDRGGVIETRACGVDICGRIVGLTGFAQDGTPPLDYRGRSQCQFELIRGMTRTGDNLWQGEIVNPENGRRYAAEMWVDEQGDLRLRGYVALPLFGETQVWKPYRGPLGEGCRMPEGDDGARGTGRQPQESYPDPAPERPPHPRRTRPAADRRGAGTGAGTG